MFKNFVMLNGFFFKVNKIYFQVQCILLFFFTKIMKISVIRSSYFIVYDKISQIHAVIVKVYQQKKNYKFCY